jgi:hypothetical protein
LHAAIFADLQESLNPTAMPVRATVGGPPEPAQWRRGSIFKLQSVYPKFRKKR